MVALVCLEKTTISFDKLYSYNLPPLFENKVFSGSRVLVPFGRSNQTRQAVVIELKEANDEGLKSVLAPLENQPVFTPEQISLAQFMQKSLFCPLYDCLMAMLPTGMKMKVVKEYTLTGKDDYLRMAEVAVKGLMQKNKKYKLDYLIKSLPEIPVSDVLDDLVKKGVVRETEDYKRNLGDKATKMVRIKNLSAALTEKQQAVVDFLVENGETSFKELIYFSAVSRVVVDNLEKKGVLEYYEIPEREDLYKTEKTENREIILNSEQEKVFASLKEKLEVGEYNKSLLFGITGSGKTFVYLKLIEETIKNGKTALMLVPEISLTPQTVKRLKEIFGDMVAVLHSGLSLRGRMDEWKKITEKKAEVVVGTRSAILAPIENLGLIVIDEAHESTYVSENSPRYSAEELAVFRAKYNNALLLLSSATPSVESYYEAEKTGNLYKLTHRYSDATLPEVFVVDLKNERERRGKIISAPLAEEILYNLQNKKQTILLLNRRGFNTALTCLNCSKSVECEYCSVPMTYHKANGSLVCHYCGRIKPVPKLCPSCNSDYIRYEGVGTQSLEDELRELYPSARVLRMDLDTTLRPMSHETYLSDFANGEYDILIGTQMIAKGLDFPNVTLVGVLSADALLNAPDWSSRHRAFALLTQVVGRSGRGEEMGRAYIQTYDKDNELLTLSANQNYEAFFEGEILNRKIMLYPPFCSLWSVNFSSENENQSEEGAKAFLEILKDNLKNYPKLPIRVMGPVKPVIGKVAGKHKRKITIKCAKSEEMRNYFKECFLKFNERKDFQNVSVSVNTNSD